jgi:hypothetical protein
MELKKRAAQWPPPPKHSKPFRLVAVTVVFALCFFSIFFFRAVHFVARRSNNRKSKHSSQESIEQEVFHKIISHYFVVKTVRYATVTTRFMLVQRQNLQPNFVKLQKNSFSFSSTKLKYLLFGITACGG